MHYTGSDVHACGGELVVDGFVPFFLLLDEKQMIR